MIHKGLLNGGFAVEFVEKHFHDHDEIWLILEGRGTGYWIDPAGERTDFDLEAGDVILMPAGWEHGSDGPNEGLRAAVVFGTQAPGCHRPGHYYMEQEGYIPRLVLVKDPAQRYALAE